jgi:hypothetical protein
MPLLFFSSGAPTYQTPTIVDVDMQITISQSNLDSPQTESASSFLLYTGGSVRTAKNWAEPDAQSGLQAKGNNARRDLLRSYAQRRKRATQSMSPMDQYQQQHRQGHHSTRHVLGHSSDQGKSTRAAAAALPPGLSDYDSDQVKMLCLPQVFKQLMT